MTWVTSNRVEWLAGLTTGLTAVPTAVAFAILAGIPPAVGLRGTWIIMLVLSLFGGESPPDRVWRTSTEVKQFGVKLRFAVSTAQYFRGTSLVQLDFFCEFSLKIYFVFFPSPPRLHVLFTNFEEDGRKVDDVQ